MTRHYPDLDSAFDWLKQISHVARPIKSITQIWVVTRHQCGISALISQTLFRGETTGGVAKCRLFLRLALWITDETLHLAFDVFSLGWFKVKLWNTNFNKSAKDSAVYKHSHVSPAAFSTSPLGAYSVETLLIYCKWKSSKLTNAVILVPIKGCENYRSG